MRPFRRFAAISLTVLLIVATAASQAATYAGYDPNANAAADLSKGLTEAARSGRRVLLEVGGNWCSWCARLDGLFERDKPLAAVRDAGFVVVKVSFDEENQNQAVLSRYPAINGYPHIFVLDARGKLLHSQETSVLEEGKGYSRGKVLAFLKQWTPRR